ncbi:hypothetical protein [Escherichia phage vB_EcoM_JNE01]|nr:hypothetical protein [Escherichia phage vB_EcoM_JNE01]
MDINDLLSIVSRPCKHSFDSHSFNYTDKIQVVTEECYGVTTIQILDNYSNSLCYIYLTNRSDELKKTEIVLFGKQCSDTRDIEILYYPGKSTREIVYDMYALDDNFVIDYSTEEKVFQQSLVHNFVLGDPGIPKIFKILDSITVDFEFHMCIRSEYLDDFVEIFGL